VTQRPLALVAVALLTVVAFLAGYLLWKTA